MHVLAWISLKDAHTLRPNQAFIVSYLHNQGFEHDSWHFDVAASARGHRTGFKREMAIALGLQCERATDLLRSKWHVRTNQSISMYRWVMTANWFCVADWIIHSPLNHDDSMERYGEFCCEIKSIAMASPTIGLATTCFGSQRTKWKYATWTIQRWQRHWSKQWIQGMQWSHCHWMHISLTLLLSLWWHSSIALDPKKGLLYWSTLASSVGNGKINYAWMDGTHKNVLVQSKNNDITWPMGLTIEYMEQKMYWCDSRMGTIERVGLDGRYREVIAHDLSFSSPISFSYHNQYLFFTNKDRAIIRIHFRDIAKE